MTQYYARLKSGRAFNGASRDAGMITHAVASDSYPNWNTALCGTKPGSRGNGWQESETSNEITCPKCLKKITLE